MNTGMTQEQLADFVNTLKTEVGEKEGANAQKALDAALEVRK